MIFLTFFQRKLVALIWLLSLLGSSYAEKITIQKAGPNESGYYAFFYAMRFLNRFDTAASTSLDAEIAAFENNYCTTEDTKKLLSQFVPGAKNIMTYYPGANDGRELSGTEILHVLCSGTPKALDYLGDQRLGIFSAENAFEAWKNTHNLTGNNTFAGIVRDSGHWKSIVCVNDGGNWRSLEMKPFDDSSSSAATGSNNSLAGALTNQKNTKGSLTSKQTKQRNMFLTMAKANKAFGKYDPSNANDKDRCATFMKQFFTKNEAIKRFQDAILLLKDANAWPPTADSLELRDEAFVGLDNCGNTCYQNAILQAINKCQSLKELLIIGKKALSEDQQKKFSATINQFFAVEEALSNSSSTPSYNPEPFCEAFFDEKKADDPLKLEFSEFQRNTQADAQEFFDRLWEHLQEHHIIPAGNLLNNAQEQVLTDTCDGFNGIEVYYMQTCQACNTMQQQGPSIPTHYMEIPLQADTKNADGTTTPAADEPLGNCLERFTAKEDDLDNQFICKECETKEPKPVAQQDKEGQENLPAEQRYKKSLGFAIDNDQPFLIIQLKRFDPKNQDKKITSNVTLPQSGVVSITDSKGTEHTFKVTAVVVHEGETLNSGHYWTVTQKGVYYDETVTPGEGHLETLLTNGNLANPNTGNIGQGYIYFLERVAPAAKPADPVPPMAKVISMGGVPMPNAISGGPAGNPIALPRSSTQTVVVDPNTLQPNGGQPNGPNLTPPAHQPPPPTTPYPGSQQAGSASNNFAVNPTVKKIPLPPPLPETSRKQSKTPSNSFSAPPPGSNPGNRNFIPPPPARPYPGSSQQVGDTPPPGVPGIFDPNNPPPPPYPSGGNPSTPPPQEEFEKQKAAKNAFNQTLEIINGPISLKKTSEPHKSQKTNDEATKRARENEINKAKTEEEIKALEAAHKQAGLSNIVKNAMSIRNQDLGGNGDSDDDGSDDDDDTFGPGPLDQNAQQKPASKKPNNKQPSPLPVTRGTPPQTTGGFNVSMLPKTNPLTAEDAKIAADAAEAAAIDAENAALIAEQEAADKLKAAHDNSDPERTSTLQKELEAAKKAAKQARSKATNLRQTAQRLQHNAAILNKDDDGW